VVGCAEHQALARELAERSITLVNNDANLLPLKLATDAKILVVAPTLEDLTPADTSSYVKHTLAESIRELHPAVEEIITAHRPDSAEIGAVASKAEAFDLLIVGTIAAHMQPSQAELVKRLSQTGKPLIAVAMRTPYDILAYPDVTTYVCTYGILEPSMRALGRVLFGALPCTGSLPVSISDQYPRGHGVVLE
jgi:beta-N-acetylhexosaminidase